MLCARSNKRGRLARHLTLLLHKMDRSRAAYFSQEEQAVIMKSYEERKEIITSKSNTKVQRLKESRIHDAENSGFRLNTPH